MASANAASASAALPPRRAPSVPFSPIAVIPHLLSPGSVISHLLSFLPSSPAPSRGLSVANDPLAALAWTKAASLCVPFRSRKTPRSTSAIRPTAAVRSQASTFRSISVILYQTPAHIRTSPRSRHRLPNFSPPSSRALATLPIPDALARTYRTPRPPSSSPHPSSFGTPRSTVPTLPSSPSSPAP